MPQQAPALQARARARGAARRARARCWALDVDCAQALHDSPRGRIMRVRLPHGLRIGACERPAAAGWGDGVCVSQSRTFFTSSSLVVCGCSRARFCARPRAAQKVAPSLAHLSGAPKQPLDGGDGGCGAHKGALGAYHPTTSHRGWSAPSVRSAAVGRRTPERRERRPARRTAFANCQESENEK